MAWFLLKIPEGVSRMNVMEKKNVVSTIGLRRLLYELKDLSQHVCIRIRVIGRMWTSDFHRIIEVTERGVILQNENRPKLLIISNLDSIVQFEIDLQFQSFEPHFHYEVEPVLESAV